MKKVLFFLSLCFVFASMTVTAQDTVVDTPAGLSNEKAYWLKSGRGDQNYLLCDFSGDTGFLYSNWGTGLTGWTKDAHDCWKFSIYKSATTGKFYIYNLAVQKFVGQTSINNADVPLVETPTNDIEVSTTSTVADHPFVFSTDGRGLINVAGQGSHGVVNWADGKGHLDDGGNAFKIIEAGDLPAETQVAIKSKVDAYEATIKRLETGVRYNVKVNNAYLCNMPEPSNINCLRAYNNAANSNSGKAVLMLEATDEANVYKIKFQQNQLVETYNYLVYTTDNGQAQDGVQVLTDTNQQYAANDKWYLNPTSSELTVNIRPNTSDGKHWNLWGGSAPAQIGLWGNQSQANAVVFEEADLSADEAAAAFPNYLAQYVETYEINWTERDNTIGYVPVGTNEKVMQTVKSDTQASTSLYECMNILQSEKYKEISYALLPVADKFYTIRNAKQDGEYIFEKYDQLQNENYVLYCAVPENNAVPSLWQFERMTDEGKDDNFRIKSVNSGLYMSKTTWGYTMHMMADGADRGEFNVITKTWVDVDGAVNLWDKVHDGTIKKNDNGTLDSWKMLDSQNNFFIEEATKLPVTIGSSGYATLNLPFAVTIPEGVTAYTAEDNADVVALSAIENDIIPANTPVILTAEPETYNFPIAYDNSSNALQTVLSGTTVPKTIDSSATAYILKDGQSGIGFYLVTSESDRTLPANKAYLGSTSTAVESKRLSINGNVTGLGSVETAPEADAEVYYDLSGRVVAYPSHGVYVKRSGEKVFIK